MRITGPYGTRPTNNVKKNQNASSGASGFESLLGLGDQESASANAIGGAEPVAAASLDVLLALQEISEDDLTRRKAVEEGFATLDSLEQLRMALLMGNVPAHVLRSLTARVSRQRAATSDPKLMVLLDEVELRAAVELAKLESALNPED